MKRHPNHSKRKFKLPVSWEVYGTMVIEAGTLEEAMEAVYNLVAPVYPRIEGSVDGSLNVSDYDMACLLNAPKKPDGY